MAETTPYFDSITAARAIADYDEQTALEGRQLISLESDADQQDSDAYVYIRENFPTFLQHLRYLKLHDQVIVLAYYCLHKTQAQLGPLTGMTQTAVSFHIRMLIKVVCAFMVLGGVPNESQITEALEAVGMERMEMPTGFAGSRTVPRSLAGIITTYARTNSFVFVAAKFGVHRPAIKRTMREASECLIASGDEKQQLMGWWIHYLLDKANATGKGLSKGEMKKLGDIARCDPEVLGHFRVRITEDNADEVCDTVFAPQGSQ